MIEIRKTFEYRLYPTPRQEQTLLWWLRRCRELYNAALVERRDAYRSQKASVNRHAQLTQLPDIKAQDCRPEDRALNSQVLQDVLVVNMVRRPEPKVDEQKTTETGQTASAPNGAAAKSGLNKSISDAGWGQFLSMLASKAAWAGSRVVFVHPVGTSQMCSGCEREVLKKLDERRHLCPHCGLSLSRDHNAARNILNRPGLVPYGSIAAT